MDRLDAMAIFVAVAEEGGFAAAARRLGRSPTAVTRAIAGLEDQLAARLFNRTTRAVALTDAGARHLAHCRRLLAAFDEMAAAAAGESAEPQGVLTLTAPVMFGRMHIVPVVERFLRENPAVQARILLLDRLVSFVDEGVDVGLRIGDLPDSSLRAIRVGQVRYVVCGSPAYLARRGTPQTPDDLAGHDLIMLGNPGPTPDRWRFSRSGGLTAQTVQPRVAVNQIEAAVEMAARGGGLTRLLSYQCAPLEATGGLVRVLTAYEPPPLPIHLVHPAGRHLPVKLRRFIDMATEALRGRFV